MYPELMSTFDAQGGVVRTPQLLGIITRRDMQRLLRSGVLVKIRRGIYCIGEPSLATRLKALDLRCGEPVVPCLGTAAQFHGFNTENTRDIHVLNPEGHLLVPERGLIPHRREGAPLLEVGGRLVTAPAWTAVEFARTLRRPRALAALDAALRSGTCDRDELARAARLQAGRRGIVKVRELVVLARPEPESPMESVVRLMIIDAGIPDPTLQLEIIDRDGHTWRVDFAWPEAMIALEYDGFEAHSTPDQIGRDRTKHEALTAMGWEVIHIVARDVFEDPRPWIYRLHQRLVGSLAA
ncbi:type IV toxin-antitoxin system AbiEi family antitoxin domain-containing protein [Mycolicibacterium brumae]|uniref:DUF559 domain-containing protein n=1 Tax=Mycolicibacterium brumae TaxID=85968 RepID=A0A2G5P8W9_9MYCO|nr:type IV toxin-antitoxin system AbiEi family antitoxin domain-containing protein [Mycolicibacterium brumae]PIB74792.1 hypothetical protein CQY22_011760 [Mycolicibacterium brumae]RWA22250.1 hypothetical protein MBRU_13235 [Mycolicibacterium brumae DSM 44177]